MPYWEDRRTGESLKLSVPETILQGYPWLLPGPPVEGSAAPEDGGLSPARASVSIGSGDPCQAGSAGPADAGAGGSAPG